MARDYIPSQFQPLCEWIEDIDGDEIYSMKAMQNGEIFIIANSTFSWWAARTSSSKNSLVIAPNPWFSKIPSPLDLIPQNWQQLKAKWQTITKIEP
jgi:hypothetical protein